MSEYNKNSASQSQYCKNKANQYLIMVSIYAAIISQEIEDDEALGILGSFLISLGEEIALASEVRIACKSEFEDKTSTLDEIEDVFDRSVRKNSGFRKKRKRRT